MRSTARQSRGMEKQEGIYAQNVLGVCSFDMKFTYMLAGWEESAHDARVLESALDGRHKKFPTPPEGKHRFYIVKWYKVGI